MEKHPAAAAINFPPHLQMDKKYPLAMIYKKEKEIAQLYSTLDGNRI
jgi:hypothetical protein